MARTHVLTEAEALELLALLLTSARIQLDEPAIYGPLRLLTAAERLSQLIQEQSSKDLRPFLKMLLDTIPDMHMRMADTDWYQDNLDALCRAVAQQLVDKNEVES
jgi:hypothetical protein